MAQKAKNLARNHKSGAPDRPLSSSLLRLKAKLDKGPDGLGAGNAVGFGPLLDTLDQLLRRAGAEKRVFTGGRSTASLFRFNLY